MRVAGSLVLCASLLCGGTALAQTSPFVGHWEGSEENCSIKGDIALDITQTPDGSLRPKMHAAGVGTLDDGWIVGDTLTLNWSNFLSHVTFTGKFVSLQKIEGTYHESITGEDCTWSATNQTPPSQAVMARTVDVATPPAPVQTTAAPPAPPTVEASLSPPAPVHQAPSELDVWKAQAEQDRQRLAPRLNADAKAQAIKQFCAYAPDQVACAARIGAAYDFLAHNEFATLTIVSGNKAVPLPASEPAAGLPSYYDVYQIHAFLMRDTR